MTDSHRPIAHFLPPRHWMNDPNGLIHCGGEYHMFFQHNPHAAVWGNMTWGHAVSRDLVRWRHLPHALHPDQPYDKDGVFSGCMVVNDAGEPTAVYTGTAPEVQCLAKSRDMLTWTKHPRNPVIAAPPPGLEVTGFRDPFVWRERGGWRMVLGSGMKGRAGAILLYRSQDLVEWEYAGIAAEGDGTTGTVWECPNLFRLGRKWVLIVSPIPLGRAIYFVGTLRAGRFVPERQGEVDAGGSLYAPLTFRDARGRRLMFGWLRENRGEAAQVAAGWSGVMSLPRVLTLLPNGSVGFAPAPEVKALRGPRKRHENLEVPQRGELRLSDVSGDALEIQVEFAPGVGGVGLKVRCSSDGVEETAIGYDRAAGSLSIDRTRSSQSPEVERDVRTTPLALRGDEPLRLRVYVDRSVVEVYANERVCLTSRVYPTHADATGVALIAHGGPAQVRRFDAWPLTSIW